MQQTDGVHHIQYVRHDVNAISATRRRTPCMNVGGGELPSETYSNCAARTVTVGFRHELSRIVTRRRCCSRALCSRVYRATPYHICSCINTRWQLRRRIASPDARLRRVCRHRHQLRRAQNCTYTLADLHDDCDDRRPDGQPSTRADLHDDRSDGGLRTPRA